MRITFVTRKFGNVERNSHCDVLHITPIRVARLFLDCNGDFAIKAYALASALICFIQRLQQEFTKNQSYRREEMSGSTSEKSFRECYSHRSMTLEPTQPG